MRNNQVSDPEANKIHPLNKPDVVLVKGVPIAGQAEQLVRVRREINKTDEMTRVEQLEYAANEKIAVLLKNAHAEADKIVSDAKNEAETIRSNARRDGDLAAKREALEKLRGLLTSLENEIQLMKENRTEFLDSNLLGIIELACDLARKILINELHTRPGTIAERARALIERMPPGVEVTLSVSPGELDVIETYLHETGVSAENIVTSLRSDPTLSTGSLRLESDNGMIDAKFLEALEEIGSLLKEQAENRGVQSRPAGEEQNGS